MAAVKTICYGEERTWNSRTEAMDFFEDCMFHTEGAERDRYMKIYYELKNGMSIATDE